MVSFFIFCKSLFFFADSIPDDQFRAYSLTFDISTLSDIKTEKSKIVHKASDSKEEEINILELLNNALKNRPKSS